VDFSIKTFEEKSDLTQSKTACLVVGVYENKKLTLEAQALNIKGAIDAVLKSGDITGKVGSTLVLRHVPQIAAERVVLVGLGEQAKNPNNNTTFPKIAQATAECLAKLSAKDALITITLHAENISAAIRSIVLAMRASAYRSDSLKSKPETVTAGVSKAVVAVRPKELAKAKISLMQSVALANGIAFTKHLADLPGNVCTPTYLANAARKISTEFNSATTKISIETLDRKQCQALKNARP
jgi:leucyl aminopeptidase